MLLYRPSASPTRPRMPNHWLLKTEPSAYSFARLVKEGRAVWDGVRNSLALSHLRTMQQGDHVLIYHTGSEKAVVGTARILTPAYPDPNRDDPRLVVVDVGPEAPLSHPVTLAAIKAEPALAGMPLIRMSRLSVMPVTPDQWKRILAMGTGK
jgi:predicted RNA-binding protein with PUA-like domain